METHRVASCNVPRFIFIITFALLCPCLSLLFVFFFYLIFCCCVDVHSLRHLGHDLKSNTIRYNDIAQNWARILQSRYIKCNTFCVPFLRCVASVCCNYLISFIHLFIFVLFKHIFISIRRRRRRKKKCVYRNTIASAVFNV